MLRGISHISATRHLVSLYQLGTFPIVMGFRSSNLCYPTASSAHTSTYGLSEHSNLTQHLFRQQTPMLTQGLPPPKLLTSSLPYSLISFQGSMAFVAKVPAHCCGVEPRLELALLGPTLSEDAPQAFVYGNFRTLG